ncbi:MAG: serine O-acetyltransferase [Methylobacter sp.]
MFENIRADTMRVHRCTKTLRTIDVLYSLWMNYGLRALVIYRFGRWLGSIRKHSFGCFIAAPLYPAYWMLSVCVRKAYGIDLDQSADIGPGFHIGHFGGIEVRNCRIGPHCNIQQQVKLGSAEITDKGPVIGEGVVIGVHAQICADVNVGDGATIGAGAVVIQDIPHHCLVLGNPGRITQRDYDNRALL